MAVKEKRPRGRPPTHGLYSSKALVPLIVDKRNMIIELVRGERLPISKLDGVAVELLARCLAKVEMIDRYFADFGMFADEAKGVPWGIWKYYQAVINTSVRLCNDLGLTPTARGALSKHIAAALDDFASAMQDANKAEWQEVGGQSPPTAEGNPPAGEGER
jgi:hypothetical protein